MKPTNIEVIKVNDSDIYNIYLRTPMKQNDTICYTNSNGENRSVTGRKKALWLSMKSAILSGILYEEASSKLFDKATKTDGLPKSVASEKIDQGFNDALKEIEKNKGKTTENPFKYKQFKPTAEENVAEQSTKPLLKVLMDVDSIEAQPLAEPCDDWENDASRYLKKLFGQDEIVFINSYGVKREDENKYEPLPKGDHDKTLNQIISNINNIGQEKALGFNDTTSESGVWVIINPLDGGGIKIENVTEFRYVLLEFDDIELERRYQSLKH